MGWLYQSSSKQGTLSFGRWNVTFYLIKQKKRPPIPFTCLGSIGDTEDGLPGEEGEQELVHRGVRGGLGQDEGGGGVRSPLHPSQVLWGADVLRAMKRGIRMCCENQ